MAVNDSLNTSKAVKYGVRVAQAFDVNVDLVSVSRTGTFKSGCHRAVKKAERLLKKAVQIMPRDPVVNDHYGDIL